MTHQQHVGQAVPEYSGAAQGDVVFGTVKIPPAWDPEHENTSPFRAYMTDLSLWIMLTDLQPHQQCAAIIIRLGGAAREFTKILYKVGGCFPGSNLKQKKEKPLPAPARR